MAGGLGGSVAWRWSTGISAAGGADAGADGTTPAGPLSPAGLAPSGSARRGLPKAGRTTSAAGRPEARSGDGGSGAVRSGALGRSDTARWTAAAGAAAAEAGAEGAAEGAAGPEGVTGVAGAAGGSPAICRSGIEGRRATISGGAIRCGRTAAGRARYPESGPSPWPAVVCGSLTRAAREEAPEPAPGATDEPDGPEERDAPEAPDVPEDLDEPEAAGRSADPDRSGEPDDDPRAADGAAPADRWTAADRWTDGAPGPGFPDLVPEPDPEPVPPPVRLPRPAARFAEADGRPGVGSAGSSASWGRTARSSSGPPGDAVRALPGRATPWMRPTGADGRTEWPSSPPRAGFCQEASRDRNRSPSLTPIEDRATVTDGGATRRHPPSQPPPSPSPEAGAGETGAAPEAGADTEAGTAVPPASRSASPPDRRRSVRRSQSPSPTRSPAFVDAGVDPRYLPYPLLTFAVGEIENVLTLPMEVVGDVRDLLPQPGKRVRHDSPRRPPERSTSNDPWHSGQVTAACVWPSLLIRR